jgi:hypothetical protein
VCNGSNSYYIDQHGDAPYLRPTSGISAWLAQRTFKLDNYEFDTKAAEASLDVSAKPRAERYFKTISKG